MEICVIVFFTKVNSLKVFAKYFGMFFRGFLTNIRRYTNYCAYCLNIVTCSLRQQIIAVYFLLLVFNNFCLKKYISQ